MPDYTCIHEEQLQDHGLKLKELETEVKFKKEKIDKLQESVEEMDKKIDEINQNVNDLILQSKSDDKELELRLKAIETELELQKQKTADNQAATNIRIAWIGIALTIITILVNVVFKIT